MTDDDDYRAERTMARAVQWNNGQGPRLNSSFCQQRNEKRKTD
jgi:hypothetical protein